MIRRQDLVHELRRLLEAIHKEDFATVLDEAPGLRERHSAFVNSVLNGDSETDVSQALLTCYHQAKLLSLPSQAEGGEHATLQTIVREQPNGTILKAYANYQLKNYTQVLNDLSDQTSSLAVLHLQAQAHYHLHNTDTALEIYQRVLTMQSNGDDSDDEKADVLTNVTALLISQATPYTYDYDETELNLINESEAEQKTNDDLAMNVALLQLLAENSTTARMALVELQTKHPKDSSISYLYDWSRHFWGGTMMESVTNNKKKKSNKTQQTLDPLEALQSYEWNPFAVDATSSLSSSQPHPKWTPLQQRIFQYNQCLALLYQKNYSACITATQKFWEQLQSSKSPLFVSTDHALLWWEVRLAVLLLYCPNAPSEDSSKSLRSLAALDFALHTLSPSSFRDETLLYLQLHQGETPTEQLVLHEKPAVQATLVAQGYEKTAGTGESGIYQAHWYMSQGEHSKAAEIYEQHASVENSPVLVARWVQALTHTDPVRARSVWDSFQQQNPSAVISNSTSSQKAIELENRPLKLHNKASTTLSSTTTNGTTGTDPETTKRSHESVLRQRAKRREAYLSKLQAKGLYKPDRPTLPDPERWIPKYDRAAFRRRNRNNNKQHQGSGISEKDAARLDVAARKTNTKKGFASKKSTAHLVIPGSGGGRKSGKRR